MAKAAVPVLCRVTVLAGLVVPRACVAKVKLIGDKLTVGTELRVTSAAVADVLPEVVGPGEVRFRSCLSRLTPLGRSRRISLSFVMFGDFPESGARSVLASSAVACRHAVFSPVLQGTSRKALD